MTDRAYSPPVSNSRSDYPYFNTPAASSAQGAYQPWYATTGAYQSSPAAHGPYEGQKYHQAHGSYLGQGPNYGPEPVNPPPNPMALNPTIELPDVGDDGITQNTVAFAHIAHRPQGSPVPLHHPKPSRINVPRNVGSKDNIRGRERRQIDSLEDRQRQDRPSQEDATGVLVDDVLKPWGEAHVFLDWTVRDTTAKALPRVAIENPKDIGNEWRERPAMYPATSRMAIFSAELGNVYVDARPDIGYVQVQDVLSTVGNRARDTFDALAHADLAGTSTVSGSSSSRGTNRRNRQEFTNHAAGSQTTANWSENGSVHSSESGRLAPEVPIGWSLALRGWKWGGLRPSRTGEGWVLQLNSAF